MPAFLDRLFGRREKFPEIDVLLLSKDDCHLCEVALRALEEIRGDHWFPLRVIKIEPGDEWYERYWDKIPVVMIDGRMAFKYHIDRNEFLRRLRLSARRRRTAGK